MCPTHIATLLSETFTIKPTNPGQPGITGVPGQDVKGQCDGVKAFNGVDGYMNNRQKIKEKEEEKKEKEKSRDKKKKDKDKESSKEEMEGLLDNGGVFDFLKSVLHLNPKSRHCIEDVQKFALFQPFSSSSSSSTSPSPTTSSSTLYKASLTPQASLFLFSFLFSLLISFLFLFLFYIQSKNDTLMSPN